MKRTTQLLGAVSATALVAISSTPAMAEGIRAGTDIQNDVSVTYDSGGVTQTAVTASDIFAVDRRVNVVVTSVDTGNVGVTAGESDAVLAFDVTNLSNDTVDLDLSAALGGGSSGGSGFTFHIDANGNGIIDAGEGAVTFLDEVDADETVRVLVSTDIDSGVSNGDTIDVVLTADAHAAGGAGSLGAELTESAGDSADQSVVDTVLADGAGDTDSANEGDFSDTGTYEVAGAQVTVVKSSLVVSDPVNGTTNPKAIPGAVIRYCIAVSNASGATATNIAVVDDLPSDVTFNTGTILRDTSVALAGTAPNVEATCSGGTAPASAVEGTYNSVANQVTGTISDVTAGNSLGLSFEVTIPAVVPGTPTP